MVLGIFCPMISAYVTAWKKSFDYAGRATRSELWWFVLFNIIVEVVLFGLGFCLGLALGESPIVSIVGSLFNLYVLAGIIPSLSLSVRRMHDIGKGWPWLLINLVCRPCGTGASCYGFYSNI
jgi:uncharacterized membrane protein YhaH (DUF805 family)